MSDETEVTTDENPDDGTPAYFSQFSPELRASERAQVLKEHEKIGDLATAYLDLRDKAVVIPDAENPDPEQLKRFREKMGLPDKAEGYEIQAGAGSEELVKFIQGQAHDMRLSRVQAQRLYDLFAGAGKAAGEEQAEAQKEAADSFGERLLETVGGDESKKDETINLFKAFLVKRVNDKDVVNKIAETGLLHDPGFAVAIAGVERALGDETFVTDSTTPSGNGGAEKPGQFGVYSEQFVKQFGGKDE